MPREYLVTFLLALVVISSGCIHSQESNSTDKSKSINDGVDSSSSSSSDSDASHIRRMVNKSENSTMTYVANDRDETFSIKWEVYRDYEDQVAFFGSGLNLTANMQCEVLQGVAYNYTDFRDSMEELNRTIKEMNGENVSKEREEPDEEDGYWANVYKNYKATDIKGIFYGENKSEVKARCKPTEKNLNLEILEE